MILSFADPNPADYKGFHQAADLASDKFRKAFDDALQLLREKLRAGELAGLSIGERGNIERLIDLQAFYETLGNGIIEGQNLGLSLGAESAIARARFDLRFDLVNPRAVSWAAVHSSKLIQEITDNTRAGVREIVSRSFTDGVAPRLFAEDIQKMIGLLPRDVTAVYNLRARLLAAGKTEKAVQAQTDNMSKRLLKRRAKNIARTEGITSAGQGQLELWQQAADNGLLIPSETQRMWIVTPDDRLCARICLPMMGQTVGFTEPFTTGDGRQVMTPSAHPSCRCAVRLIFPNRR